MRKFWIAALVSAGLFVYAAAWPGGLQAATEVSVSTAGVSGNGASAYPSMSADGRYVAFESTALNLVSDPPVYGDRMWDKQLYLRDLHEGRTVLISRAAGAALLTEAVVVGSMIDALKAPPQGAKRQD